MMKKVLFILLPVILFSCKNSDAEQICDCIEEATNYYISKGVKANEKYLGEFCKRESLTSEDFTTQEKKMIIDKAEEALLKIENKEFFEGVANDGIPKFENMTEFGKAYTEFIAKYPYADKNYFFKKVTVDGVVIIDNENTNHYYDENNIQIVTYDYTNKNFTENTIFIELKNEEKKNINFSNKLRLYPPDVALDAYKTSFNQIMEFEGAEIVSYSNGAASVRFPHKIKYRIPVAGEDKIVDNEYYSFNHGKKDNIKKEESDLNNISEDEVQKDLNTNEHNSQNTFKTIKSDKAYFYNSPEEGSIKKSYLIKSQKVEILVVYENFSNVRYVNESGKVTIGWLKNDDLI